MSHLRHLSHPQVSTRAHVFTPTFQGLGPFPSSCMPGPQPPLRKKGGQRHSHQHSIHIPSPPFLPIHHLLGSLGNPGLQSELHSKALTSVGHSSPRWPCLTICQFFFTLWVSLPLTSLQTLGKMPGVQRKLKLKGFRSIRPKGITTARSLVCQPVKPWHLLFYPGDKHRE